MMMRRFFFLILLLVAIAAAFTRSPAAGQEGTPTPAAMASVSHYTESIPVYDAAALLNALGWEPVVISDTAPIRTRPQWDGANPVPFGHSLTPIKKSGPDYLSPGATARFEVTVANSESVTRTVRLSDTLPAQLDYVSGSASGLTYDATTRTLSWEGELAPGGLDTIIEPAGTPLPYLDLADFGAVNLCDDFVTAGGSCDDVAITFNLGVNGYTFTLYGQTLSQITLSSNGVALGAVPFEHGHPQWLPDAAAPSYLPDCGGMWT
jgi:uncharacterized repeat protein (TIGR01451 family)